MDFDAWTAQTPDGPIEWQNLDPYVFGLSNASKAVRRYLVANQGTLELTPTGPAIEIVESNPYAVLYAINFLWEEYTLSDSAPDFYDVMGVPETGVIY